MAVQSKTIATGSRTRGGKGGVAIIAHQAGSNPMYSTLGIELLEAGMTPQQALDMMLRSDEGRNSRQVSILDIQGRTVLDWPIELGLEGQQVRGKLLRAGKHACGTGGC